MGFNPTRVRLKRRDGRLVVARHGRFNPTRVRLKRACRIGKIVNGERFNPTRVRLKQICDRKCLKAHGLQPHKGSSETRFRR